MILGVYWYFGFPDDLYRFKYFAFQPGLGGHMDNASALTVTLATGDASGLIDRLNSLLDRHPEGLIFVRQDSSHLKITIGGYSLFDYDFLIAKEVENMLETEKVSVVADVRLDHPTFTRLEKKAPEKVIYPNRQMLQVVGSSLKKDNAETLALRLDCHVALADKMNLITDIDLLLKSVNIHVFYYKECEVADNINLMLFFTNGRQGVDFRPKQVVDIPALEQGLKVIFVKNDVAVGHIPGKEFYPGGGSKVQSIIDVEYIL